MCVHISTRHWCEATLTFNDDRHDIGDACTKDSDVDFYLLYHKPTVLQVSMLATTAPRTVETGETNMPASAPKMYSEIPLSFFSFQLISQNIENRYKVPIFNSHVFTMLNEC